MTLRKVGLAIEAVLAVAAIVWIWNIWADVQYRQMWTTFDIVVVGIYTVVIAVMVVSAPFLLYYGVRYWWTH